MTAYPAPPALPNNSAQDRSKEFVAYEYLPLDEKYYNLCEEDVAILKAQTEIRDDAELKKHVVEVQAEAYKVCPTVRGGYVVGLL